MTDRPPLCLHALAALAAAAAAGLAAAPAHPFAPAAGQPGSTAVPRDAAAIRGWAAAVEAYLPGADVDAEWQTPAKALGPAEGTSFDVCVLGRGGQITLRFAPVIRDGDGPDFAVFENAFSDGFLELAFVEVSSDGLHFVRFPSFSYTAAPVGGFGEVNPVNVHGLAGKFRLGFGTPFDLAELAGAHADALAGAGGFSAAYRAHLLAEFPHLDLDRVRFVRLVDIPGDGAAQDAQGFAIYDPFPTLVTAGFDLDAVAVLHRPDTLAERAAALGLSGLPGADRDGDGLSDVVELAAGLDPDRRDGPATGPELTVEGTDATFVFETDPQFAANSWVERRSVAGAWEPAVPSARTAEWVERRGRTVLRTTLTLPLAGPNALFRLAVEPE